MVMKLLDVQPKCGRQNALFRNMYWYLMVQIQIECGKEYEDQKNVIQLIL